MEVGGGGGGGEGGGGERGRVHGGGGGGRGPCMYTVHVYEIVQDTGTFPPLSCC